MVLSGDLDKEEATKLRKAVLPPPGEDCVAGRGTLDLNSELTLITSQKIFRDSSRSTSLKSSCTESGVNFVLSFLRFESNGALVIKYSRICEGSLKRDLASVKTLSKGSTITVNFKMNH